MFVGSETLPYKIYPDILPIACVISNGSVWSALPPIIVSSSKKAKPMILTVASMDAASFFRDESVGADSPISVSCFLSNAIVSLS